MNPVVSGRFLALPEASGGIRHRPQYYYPPRLSPITRCEPQQRCWLGNSRRSGFAMPPSHNTGIKSRHNALPGCELLAGVTFLPNLQVRRYQQPAQPDVTIYIYCIFPSYILREYLTQRKKMSMCIYHAAWSRICWCMGRDTASNLLHYVLFWSRRRPTGE